MSHEPTLDQILSSDTMAVPWMRNGINERLSDLAFESGLSWTGRDANQIPTCQRIAIFGIVLAHFSHTVSKKGCQMGLDLEQRRCSGAGQWSVSGQLGWRAAALRL